MNALKAPAYRDTENGKIAGVCAGFAKALGVDPLYVRIAAVFLAALEGAGVLAYIAAWILMAPTPPTQPDTPAKEVPAKDDITHDDITHNDITHNDMANDDMANDDAAHDKLAHAVQVEDEPVQDVPR